jgi:starch-binding outer membrane protein, SusD/RagB family
MKNISKYIVCIAAVFLFSMTSCKRELLDPVPQTSVTDATAFDTPARILSQVNSMYQALKGGSFYGGRYLVYGDIRGEDFLNETTNVVTGYDVWLLNALGTSQNSVKNLWAQAYFTINLCNLFLEGMTAKGSSVVGVTLSANYNGEARFIRALCYYSLLQYYARPYADGNGNKPGLPLRLVGIKGSGFSDLARSSVADVYAQILSDLNFAETSLPLDYPTGATQATLRTTRAHRNTAIALKTRVYLSMQNYTSVITEANKICPQATAPFSATTGVPNTMMPSITTVFTSPWNSLENLLSMPMSTTTGDNPGTQNPVGFYWSRTVGGGEYSLNPSGIIANTGWLPTDARRSFISNAGTPPKPYLNTKFAQPSPYIDWVPVMRYPEVMLNLAEALARTNAGVNARALALLNAVRQRSDPTTTLAPADQTALINAILLERRIEFLGEGLRNNDLMRLLQTIPAKGQAGTKAPGDQGYIWPISSDELAFNHLMTDN